jgi:hypothetical protein
MAYHLKIDEVSRNGINGHLTAAVRIIDDSDPVHGQGTPEVYGIESLELVKRFGGDVERWLTDRVGPQMLDKHVSRTQVFVNAGKLKGKKIKLADPAADPNPGNGGGHGHKP